MRYRRLLIAILLLASGMAAQTANVIELSPADAARAQKAWDALQKAQAEWDSVQKGIELKYIPVGISGHCMTLNGRCVPDVWANGVEFSKSFGSIVPKPPIWTTTTGTITTIPGSPTYPCWANPPCTNCFRCQ